jgi:hypothetical protein
LNSPSVKQKRGTPSTARFRDIHQEFDTARDAYIWLVENIISAMPAAFSDPSSKALTIILGNSRKYFAHNLEALFRDSPYLMTEKSTHTLLTNGWVASVNLSNAQKFDILLRLAALARLLYPQDWEWTVPGATALLADKKAASAKANSLREEVSRL